MIAIFATCGDDVFALSDGSLPWSYDRKINSDLNEACKLDMKIFMETTMNKIIIMGYNTWLSLGEKPLPGRAQHFIITSQKGELDLNWWDISLDTLPKDEVIFLPQFQMEGILSELHSRDETKDIVCIGGIKCLEGILHFCEAFIHNKIIWDNVRDENALLLSEKVLNEELHPWDNKRQCRFNFQTSKVYNIFNKSDVKLISHFYYRGGFNGVCQTNALHNNSELVNFLTELEHN